MSQRIVIDVSPLRTRVASVDQGQVIRLRHILAGEARPLVGMLYRARVKTVDKRLGGVFCDLGDGQTGFLRDVKPLPTGGANLLVSIKRESIGEKAAEVSSRAVFRAPLYTVLPSGEVKSGPLGSVTDVPEASEEAEGVGHLFASAGEGTPGPVTRHTRDEPSLPDQLAHTLLPLFSSHTEEIFVTDPNLVPLLRKWVHDVVPITPVSPQDVRSQLDEGEEESLAWTVLLSGGGRLVFDETEALLAVDLDLGAQHGQSAKGAARAALSEAIKALGDRLVLGDEGGQIILDCPRAAITSPKILRDQLTKALKPLGQVSIPTVTPQGLVVIVTGRPRPNTLSRLTTPASSDAIRAGRGLSPAVTAARGLEALEGTLLENASAHPKLSLPAMAYEVVSRHSDATDGLRRTFSARFDIIADDTLEDGAFSLV